MNSIGYVKDCPVCKGEGYIDLIVGGTENCPACESEYQWYEESGDTVHAG